MIHHCQIILVLIRIITAIVIASDSDSDSNSDSDTNNVSSVNIYQTQSNYEMEQYNNLPWYMKIYITLNKTINMILHNRFFPLGSMYICAIIIIIQIYYYKRQILNKLDLVILIGQNIC